MSSSKHSSKHKVHGCGILNTVINKLPFELHYPHYNYLGPGTKLQKRLNRGDKGINKLDEAAKRHDLFYNQHKDTNSRHIADRTLENEAWNRVKASDSNLSEKVAAYITTNAMKAKRFLGAGLKRKMKKILNSKKHKTIRKKKKKKNKKRKNVKKTSFANIVKIAKNSIKQNNNHSKMNDKNLLHLTTKTLKAIRRIKKGKFYKTIPRVIPIPKTGGVLPLIPILASLASISTIASNAPSIIKTVKNIINHRKLNDGNPSSIGNGLFLGPYKKGYGLFLNPPKNL